MHIPTEHKIEIYKHLLKVGVLIAPVDLQLKSHPQLNHIPNLHVVKLLQGMVTRGYVRTTYAWRTHYYYLKNEGMTHIRQYLNLPDTVVPDTHNKGSKGLMKPQTRGFGRAKN
mmetsp:Transcript_7114/g.10485  ORF Transcript_7114/g.10485 Transcript_7114/m.10485 type:complete len:113 (+) Transcript_7114:49-387(+)